jgi:hypothetical protein
MREETELLLQLQIKLSIVEQICSFIGKIKLSRRESR